MVRTSPTNVTPTSLLSVTALDALFARAEFVLSAAKTTQLPRDEQPEVAFVGRSNAGKSSALNALCNRRGLARVSKAPGRTQLINLFALPEAGRLVDLPGYGFAAVPEPMRRSWRSLVGGYVAERLNLRGLILLSDVRHPLQPLDSQMLDWAAAAGRPVHILLTKCDKLGRGATQTAVLQARRSLADRAEVSLQAFSAVDGTGVEAAREQVALWLGLELVPAQAPGE